MLKSSIFIVIRRLRKFVRMRIGMEAYTDFAYLYDEFMEDVPYAEWADLLSSLIKAYGTNVKTVLDLGCGTGTLTRLMAAKGYEMMGVDYSQDMLTVAAEKNTEDNDILYINQDMRSLELLEKSDAIISVCDCINYMILDEDIEDCFKSVKSNLIKDGIFIFDFNTIYKYETVIGDTTIAENRENSSFIWENYYSSDDHINEYDVTFFTKIEDDTDAESDGIFRRFSEVHIQRGYTLQEMKQFLLTAGFSFVAALDEETRKEPTETSERIYIIARG